jgi:hypothetical protein
MDSIRRRAELEAALIEEEVARRVSEAVEARVRAAMGSDAVQQQLQQRLTAERTVLEEQARATRVSGSGILGLERRGAAGT